MIKTIIILGFTIVFFGILGDQITPYLLSFAVGVGIIATGVSTFAFVINDIIEYIPLTIMSLVYFWVSYRILRKVIGA